MKTIAVLNLKGGVGKTTISVNLSAALAELGNKVLLVDVDPQNDLTQFLGLDPARVKGVGYLLTADLPFRSVVRRYKNKFDFLPAGKKLKELELSLSRFYRKDRGFSLLLKNAFQRSKLDYDFIIFDCPPYVGLLNYNVLTYVENVILPTQCQYLSFEGSRRTVFFVHKIKALYNRHLKIAAVVPTMYDARNKVSRYAIDRLRKTFDGKLTRTIIRVNVSLAEAPAFGKTIFEYKPKSRGAKDFWDLAHEMLVKI